MAIRRNRAEASDIDASRPATTQGTHVRSASPDWQPGASPAVVLSVAAGGVVGAVTRYLVETGLPTRPGHFPWATFLVNVTGSAVLGFLLVAIRRRWPANLLLRPLLGTGLIGAYTTFSTFAVEADVLTRDHHAGTAAIYVVVSLAAGLAAAVGGIVLGRRVRPDGGAGVEPRPVGP